MSFKKSLKDKLCAILSCVPFVLCVQQIFEKVCVCVCNWWFSGVEGGTDGGFMC